MASLAMALPMSGGTSDEKRADRISPLSPPRPSLMRSAMTGNPPAMIISIVFLSLMASGGSLISSTFSPGSACAFASSSAAFLRS